MIVRTTLLLAALLVVVTSPPAEAGGRCTGSASCRACSTCSSCAHCKGGGTCGVCSSSSRVAPSTPTPRTPAPTRVAPRRTAPAESPKTEPKRSIDAAAVEDGVRVYFSPSGGCTAAIVAQIQGAKSSVKVQAYRLVSVPINKALKDANARGVEVSIILDKRQQSDKYSDATYFHNAGMTVMIDPLHAIAHNKIIIVDDATVVTGSFNFSAAAENDNAENLLIIEGKTVLAAAYVDNFNAHLTHAIPYQASIEPYKGPASRPMVDAER